MFVNAPTDRQISQTWVSLLLWSFPRFYHVLPIPWKFTAPERDFARASPLFRPRKAPTAGSSCWTKTHHLGFRLPSCVVVVIEGVVGEDPERAIRDVNPEGLLGTIYILMYLYIHMYMYISVCVCVLWILYIYIYICMCVCARACGLSIGVYIYKGVCVCARVYTYIRICIQAFIKKLS